MKGLWVKIRIDIADVLTIMDKTELTWGNFLNLFQSRVMRIKNPKNIFPPPLPSLWTNFIPYSLLPSPQQCRALRMGGVVSSLRVVYASQSSSTHPLLQQGIPPMVESPS